MTDNGMALNPSRRGWQGQLVTYVTSLGTQAITGKPYKPTTQGKNERFHQTLFRWLDTQPLAGAHWDPVGVMFIDVNGEILAEHPWPAKGIHYVSRHTNNPTRNRGGRPRKNPVPTSSNDRTDTEVLRHQQSPKS